MRVLLTMLMMNAPGFAEKGSFLIPKTLRQFQLSNRQAFPRVFVDQHQYP
jgi:hypothetical protein